MSADAAEPGTAEPGTAQRGSHRDSADAAEPGMAQRGSHRDSADAAEQNALQCTDVTLVIDGARILDTVNWKVQASERWVVLGANGAGKTSLLRVAALYQHPSSGTV